MESDGLEHQVKQLLDIQSVQSCCQSKRKIKTAKVTLFSESGLKLTNEVVLLEFMTFMKKLPTLIKSEKDRLIRLVRKELKIDDILELNLELDFTKLSNMKRHNHVISEFSRKIGQSLNILAPPTTRCLLCCEYLTMNNPPSQIVVHGMNGPEV